MKEQLKKLGGMEFYDVNFSYIDLEDLSEHYVSVPGQWCKEGIDSINFLCGFCNGFGRFDECVSADTVCKCRNLHPGRNGRADFGYAFDKSEIKLIYVEVACKSNRNISGKMIQYKNFIYAGITNER